MPNNTGRSDIQLVWMNFVKSAQPLFVAQADDRPADQFLPFRDKVFAIILSDNFLKDLDDAWKPHTDYPLMEIGNALLEEMKAFSLSMEVAQASAEPRDKERWWKKMPGRASTVAGSVKEIVGNLPPNAKHALTLFKELIELFTGK